MLFFLIFINSSSSLFLLISPPSPDFYQFLLLLIFINSSSSPNLSVPSLPSFYQFLLLKFINSCSSWNIMEGDIVLEMRCLCWSLRVNRYLIVIWTREIANSIATNDESYRLQLADNHFCIKMVACIGSIRNLTIISSSIFFTCNENCSTCSTSWWKKKGHVSLPGTKNRAFLLCWFIFFACL